MIGEGPELPGDKREKFLRALFKEFAEGVDEYGRPLMPHGNFQDLMEALVGSSDDPAVTVGAKAFSDWIAQQEAYPILFGLSPSTASRGLCADAFIRALIQVEELQPPRRMSRLITGRHFACGGDAALLARLLRKFCLELAQPSWKP